MNLYFKIILIVSIVLLSLFLFFLFLIYNFPYDALIQRANYFLKKETDTSLEVKKVKYHFLNIWYIKGVTLHLPGKSGNVLMSDVRIKFNILNFSKLKSVFILANNIKINENNLLSADINSINLSANFALPDIKNDPFKGIKSIKLLLNNGRVKSVEYSGFRISNFKVSSIIIEFSNKKEKFNLSRGMINSDIIKGKLKGYFSRKNINVEINLIPSKDFFVRYPDLKPILSSVITQNGVTFNLKGNIKSPKLVKE